uniref:Acyl-coenzyme A thioesterase THEM4 n=1 Tax=Odontella aurita TaxID=265563 RepID=A0A7S4I0M3_9STRA|mmetsp:Transcript_18219/g.52646  ORF Transcript_18219/g.52646 Transcript_18219/m.52646 type:complete len:169 (+) Transcript_18219:51-557(+)
MGHPSEYEKFEVPPLRSHAVYGNLLGDGLIERLDMYRRRNAKGLAAISPTRETEESRRAVVFCDARMGDRLTGHEGIVHGGILSLIFDEIMGWAYEVVRSDERIPAFTANLTVNYRRPVESGKTTRVKAFYEKTEGRKVYISSRMESMDSSSVYADATSVFVVVNSHL